MNKQTYLTIAATLLCALVLLSACSTSGVQDSRAARLESRQDRMDSRTAGRQARWQERGEREDARASARFNSW